MSRYRAIIAEVATGIVHSADSPTERFSRGSTAKDSRIFPNEILALQFKDEILEKFPELEVTIRPEADAKGGIRYYKFAGKIMEDTCAPFQPSIDASQIPELPGHYKNAAYYFVRCWLGMAAGIGVFGLGLYSQFVIIQIIGAATALIAFYLMWGAIDRANSATCPSCSILMLQGWDEKRSCSNGVFTCPKCHRRWRTKATWGFE